MFANGGVKLQPYLIESIADPDGETIYKATHGKLSIVEPEAAKVTASLMHEVLTRGTGARARKLDSAIQPPEKPEQPTIIRTRGSSDSTTSLSVACGWVSTNQNESCQEEREVSWRFRSR